MRVRRGEILDAFAPTKLSIGVAKREVGEFVESDTGGYGKIDEMRENFRIVK